MHTVKKRTLALLLIPAALLLLLIWYLWPRSFWGALPGYPPEEEVTACYAILTPFDPGDGLPAQTVEFSPVSPDYAQLTALLESSSYRRDLFDLFRLAGPRTPSRSPCPPMPSLSTSARGRPSGPWTSGDPGP